MRRQGSVLFLLAALCALCAAALSGCAPAPQVANAPAPAASPAGPAGGGEIPVTASSGKASEGERLLILANEAGANGEAAKQKEHLDRLVAAHPADERAHFNLGGYHFGQQDFAKAIEHYKKAPGLAPNYSPAYNILGYAYRQSGDYANAEQAFK